MSGSSNIPAPSVPMVGPDGRMSMVWFQFFQALFQRTGGTSDMTGIEAVGLPRTRRGDAEQPVDAAPSRARHERRQEERAPARHVAPRLLLTKETYKPLTLIRLYVGATVDIPAGWQLADGTYGTPNMKDLFVVGAGDLYGQGTTGGSTTIGANNLPAHAHPYTDANTTYTANTVSVASGSGTTVVQSITAGGGVTPSTTSNNTTTAAPYLPPYYAAAYIINIATITIVTDAKLR